MVLLPGCGCCGAKCPYCPDWCSYTMQVLTPQVVQSGIFFGASVNPSCNQAGDASFIKTYGICPGFTFTDTSHVHDFCRFDNCDTQCEQNGLGSSQINTDQKALSRVSVGPASGTAYTSDLFGIGVVAGVKSAGYANCSTNPEARLNSASAVVGMWCKYIESEQSRQLQIYAQLDIVTTIARRAASGFVVFPYYKVVTRISTFPLDRVCMVEQENRRCDYLPGDAVRVAPPEGLLPMDFSMSASGTSLGAWQNTITDNGTTDVNDSSYAVGAGSFSCLEQSFAPTVRIGRRDCRTVNPLP
jgi:hypothetical protein